MKTKLTLLSIFFLLASINANAQFYLSGSEPASTRWSQIETQNYKIIYHRGLDSLARSYAAALENSAAAVGSSIGFTPNQNYRRKMPVVLRSGSAYANGMVTWVPRRMELQTIGDAYSPEAYPWEQSLVIHESRHASQMQFGADWPFRWGKIVSGELLAGALAAIYPGSTFMEGDAVATETALSRAGRGRTADFLEYYRSSFAQGQHRDYYQWRYSSQKRFTPDNYRVGYITVAGSRSIFDNHDFSKDFYDRIKRLYGVAPANFRKTVALSADKKFKDAFQEICDTLEAAWQANDELRAPFIEGGQLSEFEKYFTDYSHLEYAGDSLFALRSRLDRSTDLVKISHDGKVRTISKFSSMTSRPRFSEGKLYWSEWRRDSRWEQISYSDIHYRTEKGKVVRLTKKQRYFNPVPAPQGGMLAVSEYPEDGSSRLVIIDAENGEMLQAYKIPDSIKIIEAAWVEEQLFFSGTSSDGCGIWRAEDMHCVLEPQTVVIERLSEHKGKLYFSCDRTTVSELYCLDIDTGSLTQKTSTELGAGDFEFSKDGNTLYYTSLRPEGRMIYSISSDSLLNRPVDFGILPEYPFAQELSREEKIKIDFDAPVEMSEVRDYSKFKNLISVHSWLPVYFDYDFINNVSLSSLTTSLGLGATAFFQNTLGDTYGYVAYSANSGLSAWRNSGHFKLTHTSLLPVLELDMSLNARDALNYTLEKKGSTYNVKNSISGLPLFNADLSAYIPWSFSNGGYSRGFIPKVSMSFNNDRISYNEYSAPMNRLSVSARAYAMESIPNSRIFPRLGIGAELGFSGRPFASSFFCSNAYAFLYSYLPGLGRTHGNKFSLILEKRLGDAPLCEAYANLRPRGFDQYLSNILSAASHKIKLSWDYAMPFAAVDWSFLSPYAYIRNFELTPHADLCLFPTSIGTQNLYSLGADLCVRLGNFLILPYDTRIGVSYNYNGGSFYDDIYNAGGVKSRHSWNVIFTVDI